MDTTVRFRRRHLLWRKGARESLLLDLERNEAHRFDAVGSVVIDALLAGAAIEQASALVVTTASLAPAEARRRVRALVAELEGLGLVRVVLPAHLAPRPGRATPRRRRR